MKTYSAKPADIENRWVIIDAEGVVLGRLASIIALRLRGKHKPLYTPHMDCGDSIIVVNVAKIVLTGDKSKSKTYHYHTGYIGGIKARTAAEILRGKYPERILMKAVERMLPRGPLGRRQFAKLRVYPGPEHPHEAQRPELLDVKALNQKNTVSLRSNRVPGGPWVADRAADSDVKRLFLIERALMELDHSEEDRRANALDRLADALCSISSEGPAEEWPMRKILRDVPDRLLLALMENAQARNAGRAAAKALVYCLYPDKYRDEPVKAVSEKKVHDDLIRVLQARHINSFTSLRIENAGANGATVMVQLSLGLGFPLDGRKLRLEAPIWLDVDRGIDIVVSGAVVREQRPLTALREGVVAGCVAEVLPGKGSEAVSIYLRSGEKMFDQFVIDRDQLFPANPRSTQKPPSWKHTASLAGRPHALS